VTPAVDEAYVDDIFQFLSGFQSGQSRQGTLSGSMLSIPFRIPVPREKILVGDAKKAIFQFLSGFQWLEIWPVVELFSSFNSFPDSRAAEPAA